MSDIYKLIKISDCENPLYINHIKKNHIVEGKIYNMPMVGESFYIGFNWRTSTVIKIIDSESFETKNSIYKLELKNKTMTGIEKIKEALLVAINVGEAIDKAFKDDGKISLFEGIGITSKAVKIWGVAKDFELIFHEYVDLDDNEKAELVDFFCDELELENEQTELIVEQAFMLLLNLKDFLAAFDTE